jgi:hypothetical protein
MEWFYVNIFNFIQINFLQYNPNFIVICGILTHLGHQMAEISPIERRLASSNGAQSYITEAKPTTRVI